MKPQLMDIICCPHCYGRFTVTEVQLIHDEIVSGSLYCPKCEKSYPIENSIPTILENTESMNSTIESFGRQWSWQNRGLFERGKVYGLNPGEEMGEFMATFGISDPGQLSGKNILDAGCGSGSLTKNIGQYSNTSTVVGIDISEAAIVAHNNCKHLPNVHIVRCDLMSPPFQPIFFDLIWSEGVIHHTPSSQQSFFSLSSLVKPGGKLFVWLYPKYRFSPYRFIRDILWKPYALPKPVLYIVCWLLAFPVYAMFKFLWLIKKHPRNYTMRHVVFNLFDNLGPEFQHRHTKEEVKNWFSTSQYRDVEITRDLGAVGTKQK